MELDHVGNPLDNEDLWSDAAWINNVTDPTVVASRLHDAFEKIVFAVVSDDAENAGEEEAEESEDLDDDLIEAAHDLADDGVAEDEGSNVFSEEENDDDDEYDDTDLAEGDEFSKWLDDWGTTRQADRHQHQDSHESRVVRSELQRVGLSDMDAIVERDALPERFKLLALREQRDRLRAKRLDDTTSVEIPSDQVAVWILHQLQKPGQPFHTKSVVVSLLRENFETIRSSALTKSIEKAVTLMTRHSLEPAYLMLYHQTDFSPLMHALWCDGVDIENASGAKPNPSFSYCMQTGRRQRPSVSRAAVYNADYAGDCDGTGEQRDLCQNSDPAWDMWGTGKRPVRGKPCFLELGRLLVTILDLEMLCHRLEHQRQLLLKRLRGLSIGGEQVRLLEAVVFESIVEAEMWARFVAFLASVVSNDSTSAAGPTKRVNRNAELAKAFEDFALTGLQYHENLFEKRPVHNLPNPREDLYSWARAVAHAATNDMFQTTADQVVTSFSKAVVEQYSKLPLLRKRVFDAFLSEGVVLLTYLHRTANQAEHKSVSIHSLVNESPRLYLDLIEQERAGRVKLYFHLDPETVRGIMSFRHLCGCSGSGSRDDDRWDEERRLAFEGVARRVVENTRPSVRSHLEQVAQSAVQRACCIHLATLCAEGPYEPTRVVLEGFDSARRTWESDWNVVESLPTAQVSDLHAANHRRVCVAFRGDNAVTCFTCVDEWGTVLGHTRWADTNPNTAEGRMTQEKQRIELVLLVRRCSPSVIGIAAVNSESLHLFNVVERIVLDSVQKVDGVHVPVVWVSPLVGVVGSMSTNAQLSTVDRVTRASISIARFLQNPMQEICQLFDNQRSIVELVGAHRIADKSKLTEALEWEMTLWINSVGLNVSDVMRSYSAVNQLRFVAGLGPRKAMRLVEFLRQYPATSRRSLSQNIETWFGSIVSENCAPVLRVSVDSNADDDLYHPLDGTLIPAKWYRYAGVIATQCMETKMDMEGFNLKSETETFGALILLLCKPEATRRELLERSFNLHMQMDELQEAELLLIANELIANGRSFMRRPYRQITNKMLFKLITGVTFISRSDLARRPGLGADHMGRDLLIREGDIVKGTISGLRSGNVTGIRVSTTMGAAGFISADDIPEMVLRNEMQDWLRHLENVRLAKSSNSEPPQKRDCPKWLERNAVIHAAVTGCNYDRGELRLRWCSETDLPSTGIEIDVEVEAAEDPAFDVRSVNSVLTEQILEAARANTMKIARHDLFKNISRDRAAELLRDKVVGECLIRPSKHRHNEATICVKIGSRSIANWPVREERQSNGAFVYTITDRRIGRQHPFSDPDHCLDAFVKRAVEKAQNIQQHRKFVHDPRDVKRQLEADRRDGRSLAYCFAEVIDDERPQTFYRVYYSVGNVHRSLKLHLDNEFIHLRLPRESGEIEWVPCKNAEMVSAIVKSYVEKNVRHQQQRQQRQ